MSWTEDVRRAAPPNRPSIIAGIMLTLHTRTTDQAQAVADPSVVTLPPEVECTMIASPMYTVGYEATIAVVDALVGATAPRRASPRQLTTDERDAVKRIVR
jgi:hypothetical protein